MDSELVCIDREGPAELRGASAAAVRAARVKCDSNIAVKLREKRTNGSDDSLACGHVSSITCSSVYGRQESNLHPFFYLLYLISSWA